MAPSTNSPLDADSRRMIEQTLSRFVQDACPLHERRARLRAPAPDYRLHWSALAELGVLAVPLAPGHGGLSGSAVDVADVSRWLAPGLLLEPFVDAAVVGAALLSAGDDADRRGHALEALASGEVIAVPVGGRPGDELVVQASARGWRLSGHARVVPFAVQADRWLVAARLAGTGEPLLLFLSRTEVHATLHGFRLMDGRPAADVLFDDANLPADAPWLRGAAASAALERAWLHGASACCADAVGAIEKLMAITCDYLRTRVQFGVAIGTFQALQHRLATMHMAASEARAVAAEFAASLDGDDAAARQWLRFAAAHVVVQAATLVAHEAIQMHGGMGVTEELVVSHLHARLVVVAQQLRGWVPARVALPD